MNYDLKRLKQLTDAADAAQLELQQYLDGVRVQDKPIPFRPSNPTRKTGVRRAAPRKRAEEHKAAPKRVRKVRAATERIEKRSPEQLQEIKDKILKAISSNPGAKSIEIQGSTGLTKADITLPLKQLRESGALRFEGKAAGMRHWLAS